MLGVDNESQLEKEPSQWPVIAAGGLISAALGLVLAMIAFAVVLSLQGVPTEGGYCSKWGIGWYEPHTPEKEAVFLDDGWSGLPPKQHCRVYFADVSYDNPPLSGVELLHREPPPHHLVAEGTYPGTEEYAWIFGALLLPLAIWGLLVLAWVARRRVVARYREAPERRSDLR